ncbi:MAG: hypothetical protein ACREXW_10715 [Gammaproteobacteria bacterium]
MLTSALTNEEIPEKIPGILKDAARESSYLQLAKDVGLSEAELKEIADGKRQASSNEGRKIISICNKHGLFRILPLHGIPPVTFNLLAPFDLLQPPIGSDFPPPAVPLRRELTRIVNYTVDFPLGLSASMLTANAKCIEFYARRGIDVLTYKTVRTREEQGHTFPNWVFIEDPQNVSVVDPSSPLLMRGYPGYWPKEPQQMLTISMANSFGIPSLPPEEWQKDINQARQAIKDGHQVLIVSIVSSVKKGNINNVVTDLINAASMAKEAGAHIIEANYSCPNVLHEHHDIYQDPEISAYISEALWKELRGTPLFVKIGYLPKPKLQEFLEYNAKFINGIVAINTISAEIVDSNGNQTFPGPGRETAGVSGWAIKKKAQEVATNLVVLRDQLKLGEDFVILGLGGVLTKEDYEERKATGVTVVESCTGAFLNPHLGLEIRRLDSDRDMSTVEVGRSSSAARERQEGIAAESSTSSSGGVHSPLDERVDEHSSERGAESMSTDHYKELEPRTIGEIVRLEKYGLGFVKVESTGEQYPFRFDQIVDFKGEPLKDMRVRVGSRVSIALQGGQVCEIRPR